MKQISAAQWEQLQEAFHAAVDLAPDKRAAFLAELHRTNSALHSQLIEMLRGEECAPRVLDSDMSQLAHDVLTDSDGLPPYAFGPYTITRKIGEGGMGVVYHATRSDLHSVAAIKLLRDAWLSPARRDRFVIEQRLLAQLNHPSIARLYDAGALPNGTPWIAMEYVEGVALTDYCRRNTLGVRARLLLLRAVCEAVLHAHQQLVVHRDLKPSNVLVRDDGTVRLLDFGIAKQLADGDGVDAGDRTRTGLRLLTPAYASPEQLRNNSVGLQTDVYSLGVMLYELLTGVLPIDLTDASAAEIERRITDVEPMRPSLRPRAEGVNASSAEWEDLDVLCITAMHKDTARRYRSVDALLRDIDHFLSRLALDAHPDRLLYRTRAFVRRHTKGVVITAATSLFLLMIVAFYTVRLRQARDRATDESVRSLRIQRFMTSLFQGGDDAAGPADSLRVVTLLEQGVAEAYALRQEPAVQADLYQTLGNIYRQIGRLDAADSLLSASVAQWTRLAGATSAGAARGIIALGDLRTDQARFADAERLLRESVLVLRTQQPTDEATLSKAMIALGRSLTEKGEHPKAIAVLDSVVVALKSRGADSLALLDGVSELANAQFYAGGYDAADSLNQQALAITRVVYGDRHPRVAEVLMNLGATEQERGNYVASERYFRDALSRTTSFYGNTHYRTAGNLVYLGRSLLLQNRYPEAKDAFNQSLSIREQVFGPMHPTVANTLNELGALATKESRYDDAETAFTRVRNIYRATYPGLNYKTGVATGNLADTYLYRKDYRRAEPLYRDALAHYIASQGPDHLNTGIGYIKLGRCLLRSGRFREAEIETSKGYAIVKKIASPGVRFLQAARLDLSIAYDSLGRPADAAHYREERQRNMAPTVVPSTPTPSTPSSTHPTTKR